MVLMNTTHSGGSKHLVRTIPSHFAWDQAPTTKHTTTQMGPCPQTTVLITRKQSAWELMENSNRINSETPNDV